MHTHYIKKLFNLEGTIIKNSHFLKNKIVFDIEIPIVKHVCPNCGSPTSKIHDYYLRTIKDIPIQKKFVTIQVKWNYICLIIDLYNREIIGYAAGINKTSELVIKAISRIKNNLKNIKIFHTDRGNEFKNKIIDELLKTFKIERSLSKKMPI